MEATAYQAALKIPTQIVDIVLSSAIVSCFIPVFNEIMQKKGKEEANSFAGNFINIVGVIATFISIIGIIFAPYIVKAFTQFSDETYGLTVELVRITFPMIIFTALAFSFVGFLQSYGEFNIPAFISGLSNLVVIGFLLFFNSSTGIKGVCICVVCAWAVQLLVQLPSAIKNGYRLKLSVDFKDENIKKVFKLALPILFSTAVLPINNLVSMRFASGIGDQYYSALEYAYKIYVIFYGIFSYAIGNIIFPELSRSISDNDEEGYVSTIKKSIKLIAFLLIPLTLGIVVFNQDIIRLAYERGQFTAESTLLTSGALLFYAIGIIGAGMVEILNKAFYAKQDIFKPLVVGLGVIVANLILCYVLSQTSLSYQGIALATACASFINMFVLSLLIRKEHKGIFTKDIFVYISKILISAIIMGAVILGLNYLLDSFTGSFINNLIRVAIAGGAGIVIYFLITYIFKCNQFLDKEGREIGKEEEKIIN